MEDRAIHDQLAVAALKHYPIQNYAIEFLRHNENLVYRVDDKDAGVSYVLRIYLPRYQGFRGLQQTRGAIESELSWLHALHQDTNLIVQSPVWSRGHGFVVMVELPSSAEAIPCSLATWIDGQPPSQEYQQTSHFGHQLGTLSAELHRHARSWAPPNPFLRLTYDTALLDSALEQLDSAVQQARITQADAARVKRAGASIRTLFEHLGRGANDWGLIHADLHAGNVLLCEGQLAPIDFSLSGFGPFWLDIAISLSNLKSQVRRAFLEGYAQPISTNQRHYIEAFIIMMILVSAMRHITNDAWQPWFQRRFPVIAQEYCAKLLQNEAFLYDI